jgi:hypothetical protein
LSDEAQDAVMHRSASLVLLAALAAAMPAVARADDAPIVVELFTSQGCSSCPPADRYFGELAKRPDLIALAFHIEYWNYIGWTDTYSKPWATRRQRDYQTALRLRFVYTPQIVIQGEKEGVGSEAATIEPMIRAAEAKRKPHPSLTLHWRDDGALVATVGDGQSPPGQPATLWLVGFDKLHTIAVSTGENAGQTSWDHHAVRSFRRLGSWAGWSEELIVPAEEAKTLGDDGAAVLLQENGSGPILTAASIQLQGR